MYEYDIYNDITGEYDIIFGYSASDAFRRHPELNSRDWSIIHVTYID